MPLTNLALYSSLHSHLRVFWRQLFSSSSSSQAQSDAKKPFTTYPSPINILLIAVFAMEIVLVKDSSTTSLFTLLFCILNIACGMYLKNNPVEVSKFRWNFSFLLLSLLMINSDFFCFYHSLISSHVLPALIYAVTKDVKHLLMQVIAQCMLFNFSYQYIIEKAVNYMEPDNFIVAFSHATNTALLLLFGIIFLDNYYQSCDTLKAKAKPNGDKKAKGILMDVLNNKISYLIEGLMSSINLIYSEELPCRVKELFSNVQIYSELLSHHLNVVMDSHKISSGELNFAPSTTKTFKVFEKIWEVSAELIKRKSLHGSMKISKDLPRSIIIDSDKLTQICLSVIENSVKFTEKGSLDIRVEWIKHTKPLDEYFKPYPFNNNDDQDEGLFEKNHLFSRLGETYYNYSTARKGRLSESNIKLHENTKSLDRGVLKITITDSGCGIESEDLNSTFGLSDKLSEKMKLGVHVAKTICEQMQGKMRAFSKKNRGTSVIICMPVSPGCDDYKDLRDWTMIKALLGRMKLKALVVSNSTENLKTVKDFFDEVGIEITGVAMNAVEGYEKYQRELEVGSNINIVVADVYMPIMSGKELFRKIGEIEKKMNIKKAFMMLVGEDIEKNPESCVDEGYWRADCILKEPLSAEDVMKGIGYHFLFCHSKS